MTNSILHQGGLRDIAQKFCTYLVETCDFFPCFNFKFWGCTGYPVFFDVRNLHPDNPTSFEKRYPP